jgi:hypothetical protein
MSVIFKLHEARQVHLLARTFQERGQSHSCPIGDATLHAQICACICLCDEVLKVRMYAQKSESHTLITSKPEIAISPNFARTFCCYMKCTVSNFGSILRRFSRLIAD